MTNKAPFCAFLWLTLIALSRQKRSLPDYQVRLWSLPTFQVGPQNLCNLRLINDLRLRKITYEKINLFMQNEPKLQKVKLNVNNVLTINYVQMDTWSIRKNEPKTNPNEPKTNPKRTQFHMILAYFSSRAKEMLPELHSRFPRNLAIQSLGSYDWENKRQRYKALCLLKGNDVAQVHRYLDEGAGWEICHGPVDVLASQAVRELIAFNPGKPIILTETGAVKPRHTGCSELYAQDKDGILLHDMLFAPFFSGAAGTGHVWWWRQALDEPNLWYHFARFAEVVEGIDPPAEHFEPTIMSMNRYRLYVLKGHKTVLAWCRDSQNNWKNEFVLGHPPEILESLEIDLSSFLSGSCQTQARVFDPWKNRWQDKSIESGCVKLDDFRRSVVIRVE